MTDENRLEAMDAYADRVISNWSVGAVAANILPRRFSDRALENVFNKVVMDLSNVYERQENLPGSQEIVKMTHELIQVCKAGQGSKNDYLKYVPGVNIWMALVIETEVVTAMTESVGNAFKQYFHALWSNEQVPMAMEQVETIAKKSLYQKLQAPE